MLYMYLDESGNTGKNWLDPDQPIFVYGGWLIDEKYILNAKHHISQIDSLKKDQEIKSRWLLNGHKDKFFQLVESLMEEDRAIPIFVIADKRFLMAAKLVEVFFDSAHNNVLKNTFLTNRKLKKALAKMISGQDDIVAQFGEIYANRKVEIQSISLLHRLLKEFFSRQSLFDVVSYLETLNDKNFSLMIYETKSSCSRKNDERWFSLVYPLLFQLVTHADEYGKLNNDIFSVIVDELSGFKPIFNDVENAALSLKYNLDAIKQGKSIDLELLRAADWLCGYLKECYCNSVSWSKNKSSRLFWKRIIEINKSYEKRGVSLFDIDASTSDAHNKSKLLSGNKNVETDYSKQIIEKEFVLEMNVI